jgi:hypothetical protein
MSWYRPKTGSRIRGSIALLVLLSLANMTAFARLAFAHWWWHPSGDCHYFIEESEIEVYRGGASLSTRQAALDDWASHTDVSFDIKSSHGDGDGEDEVDISISGVNYPTGWWGLADLVDLDPDNDYCGTSPNWAEVNHGHVIFNSYYGGTTGTGPTSDMRGVLCQEIGHVLGLRHSNDGCMGKGYYNDLNITVQHNWTNINSFY